MHLLIVYQLKKSLSTIYQMFFYDVFDQFYLQVDTYRQASLIDEKILSKIQSIRLIGIAKRLEEIYFPNDPTPLYLNKNSESLKLIQQIRDEAHRFGITFHRKLRSKVQIKSELDEIPGIGKVTKNLLLEHFKSLKKIREADSNELEKIVGKSKANNIINYFKSK